MGEGENQVFVFASHKHKHNDISSSRNALPQANEHSQNAKKQHCIKKTTLVLHEAKQPQQQKTRGKKGTNNNKKPDLVFATAHFLRDHNTRYTPLYCDQHDQACTGVNVFSWRKNRKAHPGVYLAPIKSWSFL